MGTVELFNVTLQNRAQIEHLRSFQICDPSILVLSLAWRPSSGPEWILGLSLSSGQVATLQVGPRYQTVKPVQAHTLEAWTLAWSKIAGREHFLYSGGDDSRFCQHSSCLESSTTIEEVDGCVYEQFSCDSKTHLAGVTSILPTSCIHGGGEVVLTGSYDEYIRVVVFADSTTRAKVLAEKPLGGGVWRLSILQETVTDDDGKVGLYVLASCMHAGVKILDICRSGNGTWSINLLTRFEKHQSMCYASAGLRGLLSDNEDVFTVLSTSFYDRKLCMWKWQRTL